MQSMPDITALLKIAQSPAGQKLLSMLQKTDLEGSTTAAAAGNYEEARQKLSKALSSQESRELLQELESQL